MKCLSVSQPFADLIVAGTKKIDLRSWNTGFRGEFLVHAPQRVRRDEARRLGIGGRFVTGAVVGKAEIFGVKRYRTGAELVGDGPLHLAATASTAAGKRYGFLLKNAKAFRVPVPLKGRLGFFEADFPGGEFSDDFLKADIIEEEYRYQWINRH